MSVYPLSNCHLQVLQPNQSNSLKPFVLIYRVQKGRTLGYLLKKSNSNLIQIISVFMVRFSDCLEGGCNRCAMQKRFSIYLILKDI
jgi:hypothetical protein